MNACFYTAIDRLPLGTVAAIEFLPVIALAALGARTARNAAALLLAVPGVYLLTDVHLTAEPLGLVSAFANAMLFALDIVLADRVAKGPGLSGIDGLAASMLIAALLVTPIGARDARRRRRRPAPPTTNGRLITYGGRRAGQHGKQPAHTQVDTPSPVPRPPPTLDAAITPGRPHLDPYSRRRQSRAQTSATARVKTSTEARSPARRAGT